jgi:hypothetical protein
MRRALAIVAVLAYALCASSSAALTCLNSKPCGDKCIPFKKICHPPPRPLPCPVGSYHCGRGCIPDKDLCAL